MAINNNGNEFATEIPSEMNDANSSEFTISYILGQMEKIRVDIGYLYEAFTQIREIQTHPPSLNAYDMASEQKAVAVGDIVKSREATNQKMLDIYEKMYYDLRPAKEDTSAAEKVSMMESMLKSAAYMMEASDAFGETFGVQFGEIFKEVFETFK
ncbi:MAG: hypothetical protein FWC90_05560 [Oscillospiraceae bacterium]|nr:hypothetical protein [Oscillospiraceae bacterium]